MTFVFPAMGPSQDPVRADSQSRAAGVLHTMCKISSHQRGKARMSSTGIPRPLAVPCGLTLSITSVRDAHSWDRPPATLQRNECTLSTPSLSSVMCFVPRCGRPCGSQDRCKDAYLPCGRSTHCGIRPDVLGARPRPVSSQPTWNNPPGCGLLQKNTGVVPVHCVVNGRNSALRHEHRGRVQPTARQRKAVVLRPHSGVTATCRIPYRSEHSNADPSCIMSSLAGLYPEHRRLLARSTWPVSCRGLNVATTREAGVKVN
ncbi:hypothetical protein OBBRIDRAFT_90178 [Obba rivulosa]|uniref:Uncharacterized protein n=1 Tax=Obba rivulosa TaxID=1052685 RepID=A0A8E2AQ78_9APHY|nr:hypothetical protein OBBRIDRAFT_90178 [Obba rivulosa]